MTPIYITINTPKVAFLKRIRERRLIIWHKMHKAMYNHTWHTAQIYDRKHDLLTNIVHELERYIKNNN